MALPDITMPRQTFKKSASVGEWMHSHELPVQIACSEEEDFKIDAHEDRDGASVDVMPEGVQQVSCKEKTSHIANLNISMPGQSFKNSDSVTESTQSCEVLEWIACSEDERDSEIDAVREDQEGASGDAIPKGVQKVSQEEKMCHLDKDDDALDKLLKARSKSRQKGCVPSIEATSDCSAAQPLQVSLSQLSESVIICDSLQDWQEIPIFGCAGLRVSRAWSPDRFQSIADELLRSGRLTDTGVHKKVKAEKCAPSSFQAATAKLLAQLSLPIELEKQIMEDSCAIGERMLELLHNVKTFQVRLELMGENVCSKWHMDSYIWRAFVAYSCTGTEYTEPANVDFWELENCGNNDCVIRDKSKTLQADVGDILFDERFRLPSGQSAGASAQIA